MRRVLFVDDEQSVLDGLKKALRVYRQQFQIDTAHGGAAALEKLREQRYDAVISDARMPEVDGEQVLLTVRECQPLAARLILSGQVDRGSNLRLAGLAHQFLAKPCEAADVVKALEHCCGTLEGIGDTHVRTLATQLSFLPMRPEPHQKLTKLMQMSNANVEEVAAIIEASTPFGTSILRVASSPLFGASRINSVADAARLLGLEVLREMLKLMPVGEIQLSPGLLNAIRLRAHVRVVLARKLAAHAGVRWAVDGVVLQDVGLSVRLLYQSSWARAWVEEARDDASQLLALERRDGDYLPLGVSLLTLWRVPAPLLAALVPPSFEEVQPKEARALVGLALKLERASRPALAETEMQSAREYAERAGFAEPWPELWNVACELQKSSFPL
ncbi:MAG: response regulator [Myxococcaceae bacterium]|nr:response regulator [Myxococcaceae bacterium]